MKRHFIKELEKWTQSPARKPLVLSGARQVGKTWLLREFGRTAYAKTAYLNFDRNERLKAVFTGPFDLRRVLSAVEIETGVRATPGDTLLIFDEIQECGAALSALKYWCEEANGYHVAAAGSLVGLSMMDGTGYPVGKTNSMTLYPMTFGEFLCALGDEALSVALKGWDIALLRAYADRLEGRLREYFLVGGMPAAVSLFAGTGSFAEVRKVQKDILSDYARDFSKHAPKIQSPRIRAIWESLPRQLAKEDKRFVSSEVPDSGGNPSRARDLRDPFEWLEASGLAYRVWNVVRPGLPLSAYRNHMFKLFGLDVGLLAAQSDLPAIAVLEGNRVFTEFKGALTEQYVQQELRAAGMEPYTWAPADSRAEVDFLVMAECGVIPVEVKAERNLRAKSLRVYREKFDPTVAVRVSMGDFCESEGLVDLPLWGLVRFDEVKSRLHRGDESSCGRDKESVKHM